MNSNMQENRRRRLAEWFADRPVPPKEKSFVSQLINGKAPFGEKAARRLEGSHGMPERFLDEPAAEALVREPLPKPRGKTINIPSLEASGLVRPRHAPAVDSIDVSLTWLQKQFEFTAASNLRLACGEGDSMETTFGDGDPVMIDTGVTTVTYDGVYVLAREGAMFIRRIQRDLTGDFLIICDNKTYETTKLARDELSKVRVIGRVLHAWNGWKLS
jgi:hypothetical protein